MKNKTQAKHVSDGVVVKSVGSGKKVRIWPKKKTLNTVDPIKKHDNNFYRQDTIQ